MENKNHESGASGRGLQLSESEERVGTDSALPDLKSGSIWYKDL